MLTPERIEEIRRYYLDGIPLPPKMQRDLLNEVERLRAVNLATIKAVAKNNCPPSDNCPGHPVTSGICEQCWTEYINGLIGPEEGQP